MRSKQAQHDPEVRAVVITGAGDKSFCAGADLKAIARRENLYHPDHGEWGFAGYVHHFIDKPTIAAVNGTALGGGTELALASDLVVADERAQFGLPEVKRGLIAAAGGVFRIAEQLPRKVAMQLLLTGEPTQRRRRLRMGPDQRGRPERHGAGRRAGAGRADHRQRAAVGAGQQADRLRRRRRRRSPTRNRAGTRTMREMRHAAQIRGRQGGTAGVRREAASRSGRRASAVAIASAAQPGAAGRPPSGLVRSASPPGC